MLLNTEEDRSFSQSLIKNPQQLHALFSKFDSEKKPY